MIKKMLVGAAIAASVTAVGASPAMAASDNPSNPTANGNGSVDASGNTVTGGVQSPAVGLTNGTLDKWCIKVADNVQNLVALVNVGLQDMPILSQDQKQTCTENTTQATGEGPLSHTLQTVPILSSNGTKNKN